MFSVSQAMIRELWRGMRFLAVGCAGLATDVAVFRLLDGAETERPVSRAISLAAATCVTWTINRRLTFARTGRKPTHELGRYTLVALVAQGLNYALFLSLSAAAPNLSPSLLIVFCAGCAATLSYGGQRLFTFAPELAPQKGDAS